MVARCAACPRALLALDSTDDCFVHAGDTHAHLKTHIIVALVEDIHTFGIFLLFWVVQKRRPKTFRSRTYLLFQSLHPGGHLRAGWEPCRSKLACANGSGKDVFLGSTSPIYNINIYIHVCVIFVGCLYNDFECLCGYIAWWNYILVTKTFTLVGFFL